MLHVYNTLTRKEEEFQPLEKGKVRMYVCGVTVYDFCHIGHARCYVTFDMIYRYLKFAGYDVTYVRNFTDVDDKIINRANEQGVACSDITERFIQEFYTDMDALGIERPQIEPKATEHIPEMIELIQKLERDGVAYAVKGDVFYSVRKFETYGKLSGKNIEDLEVGARVDVMDVKHDPLDFALWKSAKPGEPKWDSPWGAGRPGWHIECSAMSMKHLSQSFDIHGGGRDLIFPHHENEIAQSEGCTHKPFSKYWMHNGFVNINTEKMSKSLNNFMTIRDVLKAYPGEVVRLFVLSAHYRSPLDYTEQNLYNAVSGLERYYQTVQRLRTFIESGRDGSSAKSIKSDLDQILPAFAAAMDDDFNSAKVVGLMFEWVRQLNKALDDNALVVSDAKQFLEMASKIHTVLGLFGGEPQSFLNELKSKAMNQLTISESDIQDAIQRRKDARAKKDFKLSDEIRDELAAKGIILKDNPDGITTWTVKG